MISAYRYRTEINKKEFQQTVYANDIESSLNKWLIQIEELKDQVFSFDAKTVEKIKNQFFKKPIKILGEESNQYIAYLIDDLPYFTYIEISKGNPDFIAKVDYLKTEEGGRRGYASSGYRPQFQIEGKKESTSAEQLFVERDKVFPGETITAEIKILSIETFSGLLYEGMNFQLGEGRHKIAKGQILKVLNHKLKKVSS